MAWEYVGESSFEGKAVEEADQAAEQDRAFNTGVSEIMRRHVTRQSLRANEINTVPAQAVPQGFTPGTGESVALQTPLPPRNPAPGGLLPLSTPGAVVVRGYVDPATGKPTPAGKQLFNLIKEGLFDEDGLPTEKGKAFLMDRDDALKPQNLDAYTIREQHRLNEDAPKPWGEVLGDIGSSIGKGVAGAHVLLNAAGIGQFYNPGNVFGFNGDDEGQAKETAEVILTAMNFVEGAAEAPAVLGSGGSSMIKQAAAFISGDGPDIYAAKQAHDRFKDDLAAVEFGDYVAGLSGFPEFGAAFNTLQEASRGVVGEEQAAKIEERGEIAGALFGDPTTWATMGVGGLVGTAEKAPMLFRMAATVEKATVARTLAAELMTEATRAKAVLGRTTRAAEIAMQKATDFRALGNVERAAKLETAAGRLAANANAAAEALPLLEERAKGQALLAVNLAKKAGGPQAILSAVEKGRALRQLPTEVVGKTLEGIGNGITKLGDNITEALERNAMKPGTLATIKTGVGSLAGGVVGAAVGGPVGAALGVAGGIGQAFLAAPMLKQLGTFTRTVGREALQARGSVPFWQRVANNTELNAVSRVTAHLLDTATLGGRAGVPLRALGQGIRGAAAAAPVNIGFEVISDGGEISPATVQRGLAGALIFGGGTATMGGLVQGSLLAKHQKTLGDELNFRGELAPDQAAIFGTIPKQARGMVAGTAAAFPSLSWKFNEGPNSFYDPRANTIVVGKNTNRTLEAVLAHEVSHFITHKGQMESGITAALVGTPDTGGLLRSKDGTLHPEFREFMDNYNRDAEAQGIAPVNVEQAAVEYFVDSTVKDVLGMVESGELQRFAGRTSARRIVGDLSRLVVAKTPLLNDFFFKIGSAKDKGGNLVPGTGILAEGIRELPGARRMLRTYLREKAGRQGETRGSVKEKDAPIPIEIVKGNKPLLDQMVADFETDAAGNVLYDSAGSPRYITKELAIRRASAGAILAESIAKRINEGETPPLGQIRPVGDGKFEGTWLPEHAIKELAASGLYNGKQIAQIRLANGAAKRGKGELLFLVYNPATIKRPGKSAAYGSLAATFRDVVPLGFSITKAGQMNLHLLSVSQFVKNLEKRAASGTGKTLYGGDVNAIRADAYAMLEAHQTRGESMGYFVEKYGAKNATDYLNFINTVFDLNTPAQRKANPLFDADKLPQYKDGVYKTYRVDRINQATRLQGVPMPFNYEKMRDRALPASFRLNLFPNGITEPVPDAPKLSPAPVRREPAGAF